MHRPEEQSKIVRHPLYWEIIKGRRINKGNRWLSHFWLNEKECEELFTPTFAYLNYIGPGDEAGHHYHENKKEIFCPLGELDLLLGDTKKKTTEIVKMSIGTKDQYIMYNIPLLVPHAVRNSTNKFQILVVLTDTEDIYGKTYKYNLQT